MSEESGQLRATADYAQRNGATETASYLRRLADAMDAGKVKPGDQMPGATEALVADLTAAIERQQAAEATVARVRAALDSTPPAP
jgi:3,4-dihydroxy-2-butanone 4-phosphate synthase